MDIIAGFPVYPTRQRQGIKLCPRSSMDRVMGFGPIGGGSTPPGDTTMIITPTALRRITTQRKARVAAHE